MSHLPKLLSFAILMILVVPFAAFADPIARNTGGGMTMDWQISAIGYERVQLRWVAPDGEVGFAEYPNGRRVSLTVNDVGTELQDG